MIAGPDIDGAGTPPTTMIDASDDTGDIWVFGYGSLMWRPGFPHHAIVPALLRGYHRAFCVTSYRHRGTRDQPGLVLGLDRGGSCLGRAFHVAAADAPAVLAYLDERELIDYPYRRATVPIAAAGRRVTAVTYLVDFGHAQYAGRMTPERTAAIISSARGISGSNADYLRDLVAHLDDLGIPDGPLHALSRLV